MRSEQEIRNKVEELRKIRFQHSKNCQIPLDKYDVAKEYDLLIDVLYVLYYHNLDSDFRTAIGITPS